MIPRYIFREFVVAVGLTALTSISTTYDKETWVHPGETPKSFIWPGVKLERARLSSRVRMSEREREKRSLRDLWFRAVLAR